MILDDDDLNKPMMEGSDDDFSDIDWDEKMYKNMNIDRTPTNTVILQHYWYTDQL